MDTRVRISIIAAVAENGVIGRAGDLPWRLQADLKRFRELTKDHMVIVGRKTHESIVDRLGGLLPDRRTILISRQPGYNAPGCQAVQSWEEALRQVLSEEEVFVIGGAEIYRLALPHASRLYLTRVHSSAEGDAFFPAFDRTEWQLVSSESHEPDSKNEYPYTFEVWERRGRS